MRGEEEIVALEGKSPPFAKGAKDGHPSRLRVNPQDQLWSGVTGKTQEWALQKFTR
jgi:hypothetical protein